MFWPDDVEQCRVNIGEADVDLTSSHIRAGPEETRSEPGLRNRVTRWELSAVTIIPATTAQNAIGIPAN